MSKRPELNAVEMWSPQQLGAVLKVQFCLQGLVGNRLLCVRYTECSTPACSELTSEDNSGRQKVKASLSYLNYSTGSRTCLAIVTES